MNKSIYEQKYWQSIPSLIRTLISTMHVGDKSPSNILIDAECNLPDGAPNQGSRKQKGNCCDLLAENNSTQVLK